jgi:hypothetical protein
MSLGSWPPSPPDLSLSATLGHPLKVSSRAHESRSDPPNRMRDTPNFG